MGCCLVGPLVDVLTPSVTQRCRSLFVHINGTNMVRAHVLEVYIALADHPGFFTTLAFWLRSSVVSVLNSLTTIMKAPPSLLVI